MGRSKAKMQGNDEVRAAYKLVREWEADMEGVHTCFRCGKPGIKVIDRSARPHAEWYAMSCASCGLDDALNIPMRGHSTRLD